MTTLYDRFQDAVSTTATLRLYDHAGWWIGLQFPDSIQVAIDAFDESHFHHLHQYKHYMLHEICFSFACFSFFPLWLYTKPFSFLCSYLNTPSAACSMLNRITHKNAVIWDGWWRDFGLDMERAFWMVTREVKMGGVRIQPWCMVRRDGWIFCTIIYNTAGERKSNSYFKNDMT